MKLRKLDDGKLMFYCKGCEECHYADERWTFNGSSDKPTFSPSILVRGVRMTEKGLADYEEWREADYPKRNGEPFDNAPTVCHSFVTDGKIQYLNDCTHKLAGQTVGLKNEEDWFEN